MKKFFLVLSVVGALAACNSEGSSAENVKDSVLESIDSTTAARIDSLQDSTERVKDQVEATFEKTDSANEAHADKAK